MARQISVSEEVYMELSRRKGRRSFSETIKEAMNSERGELEISRGKKADMRLLEKMNKGFRLGKILGSREDWHAR